MESDLLLLGHGSRDPEGAREFLALVARCREALPGRRVAGGVIEFAGPVAPGIQEAADALVAEGAERVVAQPVLLFHAGHDKEDMPAHFAAMAERHPGVHFVLGRPFGMRAEVLRLAYRRAVSALRDLAGDGLVGCLLVARGTRHPEANGDMWKMVRLFWERYRESFPLVEGAFVSLAEPYVPAGVQKLYRLGARRIVVVPYFLNTGILVERIGQEARATALALPGTECAVAAHFGVDDELVAVILDEAKAAEQQPRLVAGVSP